ncbi:MAG: DUF3187 family protein, partial [Gammaproteobacteria bacterium]
ERIELSASLPLIYHSNGYFDNAIEKWHDWLGLTNDRRDDFPSNHLLYQYKKNGVTQYEMTDSEGGPGDIVLSSKYQPQGWSLPGRSLAYKLDLKLPTGNADKLTGSGAVDVSLSVHAMDRQALARFNLGMYAGAGISYLGNSDILSDMQNNVIYSAYLGSVWQFHPAFNLKGQLDVHSAFYDSELSALGTESVALYIGGTYQPHKNLSYELGFGENLQTDPTPDFILYFMLNYTPTDK